MKLLRRRTDLLAAPSVRDAVSGRSLYDIVGLKACASRNPVQPLWGISREDYYRTLSNILNLLWNIKSIESPGLHGLIGCQTKLLVPDSSSRLSVSAKDEVTRSICVDHCLTIMRTHDVINETGSKLCVYVFVCACLEVCLVVCFLLLVVCCHLANKDIYVTYYTIVRGVPIHGHRQHV